MSNHDRVTLSVVGNNNTVINTTFGTPSNSTPNNSAPHASVQGSGNVLRGFGRVWKTRREPKDGARGAGRKEPKEPETSPDSPHVISGVIMGDNNVIDDCTFG